MKKLNYLFGAALVAFATTMVSCSDFDNPAVTGIGSVDGPTLATVIKGGGNVVLDNISSNTELTLTGPVTAGENLNIIGNPAAPAKITFAEGAGITTTSSIKMSDVIIDASALKDAMIKLGETTEAVGSIEFKNVTITGLPYQLFYANMKKVVVKKIVLENCIIGVNGAKKKTIFDFNGGGLTKNLTINNSTIYSVPTCATNGGFFSTQSGSKLDELGIDGYTISITNSTLYNITNGKTVNTLRQNSQNGQLYVVKNCIVVDCGKEAEFLKGLNAGQAGKDANWDVDGNVFNWGGQLIEEKKIGESDGLNKNLIPATITFADPENGDFTQGYAEAGDPRWFK